MSKEKKTKLDKSKLFVRIMAFILAGIMVIPVVATLILVLTDR